MKTRWFYALICITTAVLFTLSNNHLRGYLKSDTSLAKEIQSPKDSLYLYRLANKAPFKYRVLFPAIVNGSYTLAFGSTNSKGFYYTYKFWSFIFLMTSACLLFYLMKFVGFNNRLSLLGTYIFLLMPAILMAYSLPVHTREDPLAYCIFIVGLIALIKEQHLLFVATAVIGVLCRETLLLLPLLYFFFSGDKNLVRRFLIPFVPAALWVLLRVYMGQDRYDVWEGLRWNLNNPDQVIGFLFITFNFCWISFILQHVKFWKKEIAPDPKKLFFYRTAIFSLIIILLTTFFGGIYNEIRLLYLFAPWMIFFFLDVIHTKRTELLSILHSGRYWLFFIGSLLVCVVMMYFALKYQAKLIIPGRFAVPYDLWIVLSIVYVFFTITFIPLFIKLYSLKPQPTTK